ncbi:MAG: pyridoxal-phosphate dependent enzyme [Pyrinomonadaceae bacterium]|nr:pyridoxal-phosphate dependent enzyme [Pyrinomonadaceae bacterium]MCX7640538.1 pyridoxal-phosphate dependent enzyme [Pyrinomonadaceae bacterium]MDW8303881.1 pyridoxal-phosphate dependent enzyme [Acidobacteriota bacterium]
MLNNFILPTVFIESDRLKEFLGLDVTIITETFQHTGSFKFRAACNLALKVPNETILTASSGNFGQALAKACKILDKKCIVVMPKTSSRVKIEAVRSYGAKVELIDTNKISRNERVLELSRTMPEAYVASAYDDAFVVEGNATLGKEISQKNFDVVIVPIGGGGLISGIIKGLRDSNCASEVIGAEPSLANDAAMSLKAGQIIKNPKEPKTIADGARTISLGNLNWEIIKSEIKKIIEVPETMITEAVRHYFYFSNLKVEPTGALSLGAVIKEKENFKGRKIGLVVSGGNVDRDVYLKILNEEI